MTIIGTVVNDNWMHIALQEIKDAYGVDTFFKAKTLHKFGRVLAAAQDTATTVATLGASEANETYVNTNAIDGIVSSSTSDNGTVIAIEGHSIDIATGDLTFVVQTVALTGQTKATLPTPLARCTRAYVANGTFASPAVANAGDVYLYASAGVTLDAGVPQTASSIKCVVVAGLGQSEKCATAFSSVDYGVVTRIHGAASRASAASNVDFRFEVREQGGIFRPRFETTVRTGGAGEFEYYPRPFLIIKANSDCRMVVIPSASSTDAVASFDTLFALAS
jgi:hypothetical protein